jgi:hypothetical protein
VRISRSGEGYLPMTRPTIPALIPGIRHHRFPSTVVEELKHLEGGEEAAAAGTGVQSAQGQMVHL